MENQGSLDAQEIHVDKFVQPLSPHVVSGWMQTQEPGKRHGVAPTNPPENFPSELALRQFSQMKIHSFP